MAKKFSSEMSSRGTVKVTDKLIIQNIDTGAVEYTTVAELLTNLLCVGYAIIYTGNINDGYLKVSAGDNTSQGYIGWHRTGGVRTAYMGAGTVNLLLQLENGSSLNIMGGNISIGTSAPTAPLHVVGLLEYADNAAALAGGLTAGAFYRTGDALKIVHD